MSLMGLLYRGFAVSTVAIESPLPTAAGPVRGLSGWWLPMTCVSVAAAAFPGLRIELGGLLVPLHVIPLALSFRAALPRLALVPPRVRFWAMAFIALFAISVLPYGSQFGDLIKMITSAATVFIVAALVRTRRDFLVATLALAVAGLIINARGLQGGMVDSFGYQPLKGIGNKNSYSLYALPLVLLAGFVLLHFKRTKIATVVLILAILSTAFVMFTGANRSGWAGIIVIGVLLAAQARQWRALMLVGGLGLASYTALVVLGTTEVFEFRMQQTSGGYESDEMRQSLFIEAINIGLDNPLLGVGVQQLPYELAKRTRFDGDLVDPHNFLGYIFGGCGLFTLGALAMLALALWQRPPSASTRTQLLAHDLVRMLLILFVMRGMFSREIFFIASFPIALGLALGLRQIDAEADA